jgi:hypothetical protein
MSAIIDLERLQVSAKPLQNERRIMAKHGQERNLGRIQKTGKPVVFTDATTGEVVYSGPMSAMEGPTVERFCAKCRRWHKAEMVLALFLGAIGCPDCGTAWDDKGARALGDVEALSETPIELHVK